MKPTMARVSISLAAVIFSAALFGSVLGQAANSTLMSALGLAPSPTAVPGPESSFGPAPPPGPDCFTILLNLSDCLTYVQPGSNLTKPDKPCCPELSSLVDSSPFCLCKLLGDPESTGFNIDINRALKLPSVCAVSTPPVSLCSGMWHDNFIIISVVPFQNLGNTPLSVLLSRTNNIIRILAPRKRERKNINMLAWHI